MALRRRVVGSVMLSQKDPNTGKPKGPNYIKFDKGLKEPIQFQPGQCVRVESKKFQLESLAEAEAAGKLTGKMLEEMRAKAERIPDFVLGELVILEEK